MSVEFKNYYDVLGVAKNASDADIKKAFRKLARKYHPDIAKDKSAAETRFKEINEANEVLGDPDKRRKFDELGEEWNRPGRQSGQDLVQHRRRGRVRIGHGVGPQRSRARRRPVICQRFSGWKKLRYESRA